MNDNGVPVEAVVGDGVYSEKEIIEYTNSNNIKLVSKLSKTVTEGNRKNELDHQFTYNKDAKMYVCPQGHMAVKKPQREKMTQTDQQENHISLILRNAVTVH